MSSSKTVVFVNSQGNDVEVNDTPGNVAAMEAAGYKQKTAKKSPKKAKD